jgi:hypothetical protein
MVANDRLIVRRVRLPRHRTAKALDLDYGQWLRYVVQCIPEYLISQHQNLLPKVLPFQPTRTDTKILLKSGTEMLWVFVANFFRNLCDSEFVFQ